MCKFAHLTKQYVPKWRIPGKGGSPPPTPPPDPGTAAIGSHLTSCFGEACGNALESLFLKYFTAGFPNRSKPTAVMWCHSHELGLVSTASDLSGPSALKRESKPGTGAFLPWQQPFHSPSAALERELGSGLSAGLTPGILPNRSLLPSMYHLNWDIHISEYGH